MVQDICPSTRSRGSALLRVCSLLGRLHGRARPPRVSARILTYTELDPRAPCAAPRPHLALWRMWARRFFKVRRFKAVK